MPSLAGGNLLPPPLSSSLTNRLRVGGKVTGNFFLPLLSLGIAFPSDTSTEAATSAIGAWSRKRTDGRNKAGACFLYAVKRAPEGSTGNVGVGTDSSHVRDCRTLLLSFGWNRWNVLLAHRVDLRKGTFSESISRIYNRRVYIDYYAYLNINVSIELRWLYYGW